MSIVAKLMCDQPFAMNGPPEVAVAYHDPVSSARKFRGRVAHRDCFVAALLAMTSPFGVRKPCLRLRAGSHASGPAEARPFDCAQDMLRRAKAAARLPHSRFGSP